MHHNQDLIVHQNINCLQNKIEELKEINKKLKARIIVLTQTKIDSTYTDSQFRIFNYRIFRNDRKKGGGGVLVYIKENIVAKRLKLPTSFKILEVIALDIKLGVNNFTLIGIYRSPKNTGVNYYSVLEEELNTLHSWALLQSQYWEI